MPDPTTAIDIKIVTTAAATATVDRLRRDAVAPRMIAASLTRVRVYIANQPCVPQAGNWRR
jgi:hypothetical protein